MTSSPPPDLRLSGSPASEDSGWDDQRVKAWLLLFMVLGIAFRLLRLGLNYPLWSDEAYLACNVLDRD
jgi:hypothetical protein